MNVIDDNDPLNIDIDVLLERAERKYGNDNYTRLFEFSNLVDDKYAMNNWLRFYKNGRYRETI